MLSAASNSHLHVRSTSITEILEVVARLLEWRATLHLYQYDSMYRCGGLHCTCICTTVCTGVGKRLHTLSSHPTLGKLMVLAEER